MINQPQYPTPAVRPAANPQFAQQPLPMLPDYTGLKQKEYMLSGALGCSNDFIKDAMRKGKLMYKMYNRDEVSKVCYSQDGNGKIIPMCIIVINSVTVVNPEENGTFEAIAVDYVSGDFKGSTIIPYNDFVNKHLLPYFKEIVKYSVCKDKDLCELLFAFIHRTPKKLAVTLPKRTGWYMGYDPSNPSGLHFIQSRFFPPVFSEYLSDGIKNRQLILTNRNPDQINADLVALLPKHWKFKFVWVMHIASLLLTLFSWAGIEPTQMLVLTSSDNVLTNLLISLIKTNRYNSLSTMSLNASRKEIKRLLDETNDGVALFRDSQPFDEEKNTINAIRYIKDDLLHTDGIEDYAKHLTVLISAWPSQTIEDDEMLLLSFDDVTISDDEPVRIQKIVGEFDYAFISYIMQHPHYVKDSIMRYINDLQWSKSRSDDKNRANMFVLFSVTERLLREHWGLSLFSEGELYQYLCLFDSNEAYGDRSQVIVKEFISVSNELIRDGTLKLVDRKHSSVLENVTNTLVVMDNTLAFAPETMEKIILPRMTTVKRRKALIKALEDCSCLYGTLRKKQPITRKNENGDPFIYRPYGIDRSIFADDVIQRMEGLSMGEYFCDKDEVPFSDFLPLVINNDRIAGKRMKFSGRENNIVFVTGMSGYGKSYTLAQLVAYLAEMRHRVIIFDSSNSFNDQDLQFFLPFEFIQEHITIHDLRNQKIPVNLLAYDDTLSRAENVDEIANILFAPVEFSSPTQFNVLKTTLLNSQNEESQLNLKNLQAQELVDVLRSNGRTKLLEWLEANLMEISEYGMENQRWEELFEQSQRVVIIRTGVKHGKRGNPIFDMLLAKLYNHQMNHPDEPLDIVIDELGDQNTTAESPIRSIVTKARKANTAFIGATQNYLPDGTSIGETMCQAKTQIFLKPSPKSENAVADTLRYGKKKKSHFDAMKTLDVIVKSDFYSKEQGMNTPSIVSGKICSYEKWQSFLSGNDTSNPNE